MILLLFFATQYKGSLRDLNINYIVTNRNVQNDPICAYPGGESASEGHQINALYCQRKTLD